MTSKQKYYEFCKKESIPIFSLPWWLDSVCGEKNWDVIIYEKGGQIWGTMPYYKKKKYFFYIITMPKLTQTMGVYIKYPKNQKYYKKLSWEKEIMNYFIKNLPKFDNFSQNFYYTYTNWLPFYWNEFKQTTRYTYSIEKRSIEELEKRFETDIRRRRRKADNLEIEVFESEDIQEFYKLNKKTFARKGRDIPYSFEFIEKLYHNCKDNNAVKMFFSKDKEGTIIAGTFLVYDENTVYYIMGGVDSAKKDLGGMDVVQFESIKFALESSRKFDFEGSMIESIEKYFRSFGAVQQRYFNISKNNSKILKIRQLLND